MGIFLLSIAAPIYAGEVTIYGGAQKPGELSWANASLSSAVGDLAGDFGGTFGARFSAGRVIGFEQSIGYSPRFAKPGVKAFQTDSNLLIQGPGNVVPYGMVGFGLVRTWGREIPDLANAGEVAAFLFSVGSNFAINYGGGLKVRRIAGPIGLSIDVRGYTLPGFEAVIENNATKKGLSFIQTTAGLVFTW